MQQGQPSEKLLPDGAAVIDSVAGAPSSRFQRDRITWRLALSVFAAFWGALHFGWNTGVINNPKNGIVDFLNQTVLERFDNQLSDYHLELLWSLVVFIFAIGGLFGALTGGCMADRLGRARAMVCNSGLGLVAALACSLASVCRSPELLVIGRLLTGFCSAVYTCAVPLYITEVAPQRVRGGVGVINQLGVVTGLLLSQVASTDSLLGGPTLWPILFALAAVPCALQLALLPLCPESPRHLLLTRGSEAAAAAALAKLRGHDRVASELAEMAAERPAVSAHHSTGCGGGANLCTHRELRLPLLVGIVLHLSQQLSGINVIFYYSSDLFVGAGASSQVSKFATVAVGFVMVVMTGVTIPLMDRAGRRCLHLTGLLGLLLCSIGFTACFTVHRRQAESGAAAASGLTYASIGFALLIVVFFALGPGSIPWMMMSEMFHQDARSAANAVGVLINWLANFGVGLAFPVLVRHLGTLLFVPFSSITAACLMLLFLLMPETKGRAIDEIVSEFATSSGRGAAFRRVPWLNRRPNPKADSQKDDNA